MPVKITKGILMIAAEVIEKKPQDYKKRK